MAAVTATPPSATETTPKDASATRTAAAAAAPAAAAPAAGAAAAGASTVPAGASETQPGAGSSFASASLYVGDIDPDVTEGHLFEVFSAVGPVASIRVCRDAVTRRSLGYAYVNFHVAVDAERALDTMNYQPLKGRPMRIMWSHRDPSIRRSGEGNVFIKNLDKSIDNKMLYDTFSAFGNILSCKVAQDETGASRGYGFVHFDTREAAEFAIESVNSKMMKDKIVYVGFFKKREEREKETGGIVRFTNVFLKNLPESWDTEKLTTELGKFGEITRASVMTDSEGKSKCFGFANFSDFESAQKCIDEMNNKELDGKTMYASRAQAKRERESEIRRRFEEMKQERLNRYQGINLYVKNLDETTTDEELREAFKPFGDISSAKVMKDERGMNKGFGFVCFNTPEEATKAVNEMNGKIIGAKPIYVALAQRKEQRRAQLEAQHQARISGMRMARMDPNMAAMQGQPGFAGQPMYFPGAGMPPQARQGGYFPGAGQMMPRARWPQGVPPGARGFPQGGMPPNFIVPVQQRQPRQNRQRMPNQPGQPGGKPGQPAPQQQQKAAARPAANAAATGSMSFSSALAAASPDEQKKMLGEKLFPLIHRKQEAQAPKITGMLLEMDNGELLHLIEAPDALDAKISEAMEVLREAGAL